MGSDPEFLESLVIFALMAGFGYWMWSSAVTAARLMSRTPTSRIATATPGLVELSGQARPVCEAPLFDPIAGRSCVWFRIISEKREGWLSTKWRTIEKATSPRPIVLEDATGFCAVLGAVADDDDADQVIQESYMRRHRIWRLKSGDPLYVLGHFERLESKYDLMRAYNGDDPVTAEALARYRKVNEQASGLMRLWKRSGKHALERFDTDGDGTVDADEWEKAREMAQQLARKRVDAEASAARPSCDPDYLPFDSITHWVRAPADGRPLIIGRGTEGNVAKRLNGRRRTGLSIFIIGVLGVVGTLWYL